MDTAIAAAARLLGQLVTEADKSGVVTKSPIGAPSDPMVGKGTAHPFVGRYVICRCYGAGVHAGVLVSMSGSDVILRDSRRLWSWKGDGVALSGVAQLGMKPGQRIDTMNPLIALTDVIECIPAAPGVQESINGTAAAR